MHFGRGFAVVLLGLSLAAAPARGDGQSDLQQAVAAVSLYDFDSGYRHFQSALQHGQRGSEAWQQAIYGSAVCAQQMTPASPQRIAEAQALFTQLLDAAPDSCFAPRAMMNLGRIAELSDYYQDAIDLPAARRWYQQVIRRWPGEEIAGEATLRLAASFVQTYEPQDVRRGIDLLEQWLADHPADPLASAMWQYLGDTYFYPQADYSASLRCYTRADQLGWTDKGRQGPIYWRMAVMAERYLNDPATAVKYYTRIVEVTPFSGKAYESQVALRRLNAPVPPIRIFADEPPAGGGHE